MSEIHIRKMMREDVMQAAALERACFSQPWTERAFLESMESGHTFFFLAEREGELIGLCGCRMVAGEGEISNVSVKEEERRQGIASGLLKEVLRTAGHQGVTEFTLEVRQSNHGAIALYESVGFVTEGFRKGFYMNPKEDALVMWKR